MLATSKEVRFTVDEYFRMNDAGVFGNQRVELINGRVFPMHAQGHPHQWTISRLGRLFMREYAPERFWVSIQGTYRVSKFNASDPDLHIVEAKEGSPEATLPIPFLVIEVSDTTYRRDIGTKLRIYAEAGNPEYWVINLKKHRIEIRKTPVNDTGDVKGWRYVSCVELSASDVIELPRLADRTTTAAAILPSL